MKATDYAGKRVHLMGIGGSGMSALVPLLRQTGAEVSGCDLSASKTVERLRTQGVPIDIGHDQDHMHNCDICIHSSAISTAHQELRYARENNVLVLNRSACLASLLAGQDTIAVVGSHGKTSTTWMLAHFLRSVGLDPTVMVGGTVPDLGHSGGHSGAGDWFVAELDESDGGFLQVEARLIVLTNLEAEHARHYGGYEAMCDVFAQWLAQVPPNGAIIAPDHGVPERIFAHTRASVIRCGPSTNYYWQQAVFTAESAQASLVSDGQVLGQLIVPTPGAHMLDNALLAYRAARQVAAAVRPDALANCQRVRRRFTDRGTIHGIRVIEDYAHHPTEIKATVAAAACAGGHIHAIFQPHRYTRTADCFAQFLRDCDGIVGLAILPVYAAGEEAIVGASGRDLAEAIAARRLQTGDKAAAYRVQYTRSMAAAAQFIASQASSGDTCLVLGAGDVHQCVAMLREALSCRS